MKQSEFGKALYELIEVFREIDLETASKDKRKVKNNLDINKK